MLSGEIDINPAKPVLSVGEEFMNWAENSWALKDKYSTPAGECESAPYSLIRQVFIEKINKIIGERINIYL